MKAKMWIQFSSSVCRIFQNHHETIMQIVSGCDMLCETKCLYRNENFRAYLYWLILWDNIFKGCKSCLHNVPLSATTKGVVKIYWYAPHLTYKMVKFNKPVIVIYNDAKHTVQLIDVIVPQYYTVVIATANKITKYKDLQIEIQDSETCKRLLLCRLWLVNLGLHVTALQITWLLSSILPQKIFYRRLNYWSQYNIYRTSNLKFKYRYQDI